MMRLSIQHLLCRVFEQARWLFKKEQNRKEKTKKMHGALSSKDIITECEYNIRTDE